MKKSSEAKGFGAGNAPAQIFFLLGQDLLQYWDRFVAADEHVELVQPPLHLSTHAFAIPVGGNNGSALMLTIPQKVGDASADLHAGEGFVELRVVDELPHFAAGQHALAELVEALATREPA